MRNLCFVTREMVGGSALQQWHMNIEIK